MNCIKNNTIVAYIKEHTWCLTYHFIIASITITGLELLCEDCVRSGYETGQPCKIYVARSYYF
jgi:hypothetical protein